MTNNRKLQNAYKRYQKANHPRSKKQAFFLAFLPEIIFRTFKLEGEPVTRKLVKAVFSD